MISNSKRVSSLFEQSVRNNRIVMDYFENKLKADKAKKAKTAARSASTTPAPVAAPAPATPPPTSTPVPKPTPAATSEPAPVPKPTSTPEPTEEPTPEKPSFFTQAKNLAKKYGGKALQYAKENPLATAGAIGGGIVGGLTGGAGGAYVGAQSGRSLGSAASKGINAIKSGAKSFSDRRKELGTMGAIGSFAKQGKDFIKNDALRLANQMGGRAIDYVRENPKKALARVAGGVAGGLMGGAGGAFTGQAAGGRIAAGAENLKNAVVAGNETRKKEGLLGAVKKHGVDALKGAGDIGAGALAFGNMYGKYKQDQSNLDLRKRMVGKRDDDGTAGVEDEMRDKSYRAGLSKPSSLQFKDKEGGNWINNDPNSEDYGRASRVPWDDPNSVQAGTDRLTGGGGYDSDYIRTLKKAQRTNTDTIDSIRSNMGDAGGGVAGAATGAGLGAAGVGADAINNPARSTGRTATDYAKTFGNAGKRFFNRLRGIR